MAAAVHHILVVSDLHLGGRPASGPDPGFQMCPPASRRRLARFIHRLADPAGLIPPGDTRELLINGDFIDFLAEEPFAAFTGDASVAITKLQRTIRLCDEGSPEGERVFPALAELVQRGHRLTILLGNHDIELALPQVRRALLHVLTAGGPGHVEFIFDGEAYVVGDVLIEHGNRYDGWNAVAYGALRAFKSAATRAEANASFEAPAGSRLVAAVMNPLKIRYRFIDLLKPENETVIPILCALEPKLAFELTNVAPLWLAMRGASGKPGRVREEETYIAGGVPAAGREPASPGVVDSPAHERACQATEAILADARAAAQEVSSSERAGRVAPDDTQIAGGARDWLASNLSLWRARAARPFQRYRLLARALAAHRKAIATTFELTSQDPPYYTAASRLHQEAGARVVLFGHTHLAKAIALGERGAYLNTGTWVPTIRLPASFYEPSPDDPTIEQLAAFVDDLASNRFEPWTSLQTCCAHVRLAPDGTSRAALCEVQADGSVTQLFADAP